VAKVPVNGRFPAGELVRRGPPAFGHECDGLRRGSPPTYVTPKATHRGPLCPPPSTSPASSTGAGLEGFQPLYDFGLLSDLQFDRDGPQVDVQDLRDDGPHTLVYLVVEHVVSEIREALFDVGELGLGAAPSPTFAALRAVPPTSARRKPLRPSRNCVMRRARSLGASGRRWASPVCRRLLATDRPGRGILRGVPALSCKRSER
jgi:hypothetical protein